MESTQITLMDPRSQRLIVGICLAIALLLPIFPLPGPANVSSLPWKPELAVSFCLLAGLFLYKRKVANMSLPRLLLISATLAFLFALFSLASAVWAASGFSAIHHSLVWLVYALILTATFVLIRELGSFDHLIQVFATVAAILFALIVFDLATLVDFAVQEGAIRIRYAKYAEMLVTFAPLLFALPLYKKGASKWAVVILPALFAWITAMLSLSKGAFISGSIGLGVFFFLTIVFAPRRFRRRAGIVFVVWVSVTIICQFGVSFVSTVPSTVEYISGSADTSRSTTSMRVFNWKITWEMFKSNPLVGVGADNFGTNVNKARTNYAAMNPNDPDNAIGEDYIFERAHNEPLQIMAELGLLGIILFLAFGLFIVVFVLWELMSSVGKTSPIFIAAISGCLAFTISSMFSSFSFRAFQNGVVFFAVLGVAFAFSSRIRSARAMRGLHEKRATGGRRFWLPAMAVSLLLIYSGMKGVAHYSLYFAERSSEPGTARTLAEVSAAADPDLSGAYLTLVSVDRRNGDIGSAAANYEKAIQGGLGISQMFSNLAAAYAENGDMDRAEASLRRGIAIFPRSMFLRARLAETLRNAGRGSDAETELEIAREIDLKQTNGWNAVLSEGILNAHLRSQTDPTFAKPPDLLPAGSIALYAGKMKDLPDSQQ